ncbi:MAG TPA: cytochrome c maturation protein CcmE [Gemmatimonadales bacterium]|nr:cytochrome c maturation protein CcmE [Gemmatimonadales bacterium]
MKPGTRFLLGAGVVIAGVAGLIITGVKETGVFFLTPTQLVERTRSDPSFHDVGLKVGAKVVPGSVRRDQGTRTIAFSVSDGTSEFPVTYTGLVPDTFTDASNIEVIVEGKYGRDGVFHATEVLAKCGSRYEAEIKKSGKAA